MAYKFHDSIITFQEVSNNHLIQNQKYKIINDNNSSFTGCYCYSLIKNEEIYSLFEYVKYSKKKN